MHVMRAIISVLSGILCLSATAVAQEPTATTDDDVLALLKRVDEATRAVKAFSYEAEFRGEGPYADRAPRLRGTLNARQARRRFFFGGGKDAMRFQGELLEPGADEARRFDVATDGRIIIGIDHQRKLFTYGSYAKAKPLLQPMSPLFMREFFHPTPFRDEITGKVARLEGIETIGGVPCDVVYVVYRNDTESRWYFGREDALPRRVDRLLGPKGKLGAIVLSIADLSIDPEFDKEVFRPKRPQGYDKRQFEAPRELLAVGSQAPDWELKTPDGKTVRLSDLRENVVVLDFWANWCVSCKMSMPAMQRVHERYRDRPVKVFGLSCWKDKEKEDPVAYMKSRGLTYTLLLDGDQVAKDYGVSYLPTFCVIDPQGRVAHAGAGVRPNHEGKLVRIIDKTLQNADR